MHFRSDSFHVNRLEALNEFAQLQIVFGEVTIHGFNVVGGPHLLLRRLAAACASIFRKWTILEVDVELFVVFHNLLSHHLHDVLVALVDYVEHQDEQDIESN